LQGVVFNRRGKRRKKSINVRRGQIILIICQKKSVVAMITYLF
jgi:hypothetical protein